MSPQPGWYPDPASNTHNRYWNGQSWTDLLVPAAVHRPEAPFYQAPTTPPVSPVQAAQAAEQVLPVYVDTSIPTPPNGPTNFQPQTSYPTSFNYRQSYTPVNKNTTGIILGSIIGGLAFIIVTVISVLALFLFIPAVDDTTPSAPEKGTPNSAAPTDGTATDNPPVEFAQGYTIPSEASITWTVPAYWETVTTSPTTSTYKTRTCDIKTFNNQLSFKIPATIKSDEELAATLLKETTHTETATILNEAYSVNLKTLNQKPVIMLATPWNMEITSTVNGVPNTPSTIYGIDAINTSITNNNSIGMQVGCEIETDLEAVFNELGSEGHITVG